VDYSKAFDTISHPILFQKLINTVPTLYVSEELCPIGNPSQPASSRDLELDHAYLLPIPWTWNLSRPIILSWNMLMTLLFLSLRTHQSICKLNSLISLIGPTTINSVNKLKTTEIVFHRPRLPNKLLPPLLPGIERVDLVKILGIYLSSTLSPAQCSPYQPFDLSVQPATFSSLPSQIPEFVSWIL